MLTQFQPSVVLLYPPPLPPPQKKKTKQKSKRFSDVFRGYRNATPG